MLRKGSKKIKFGKKRKKTSSLLEEVRIDGGGWAVHQHQQIRSPVGNPTPEGDHVPELLREEFPLGRPREVSPGKGFPLGPLAWLDPELLHH